MRHSLVYNARVFILSLVGVLEEFLPEKPSSDERHERTHSHAHSNLSPELGQAHGAFHKKAHHIRVAHPQPLPGVQAHHGKT